MSCLPARGRFLALQVDIATRRPRLASVGRTTTDLVAQLPTFATVIRNVGRLAGWSNGDVAAFVVAVVAQGPREATKSPKWHHHFDEARLCDCPPARASATMNSHHAAASSGSERRLAACRAGVPSMRERTTCAHPRTALGCDGTRIQAPRNLAARLPRKADTPSAKSAVCAQATKASASALSWPRKSRSPAVRSSRLS